RGATTLDGVKFRTRAGMGRCHTNFCGHRLVEIMARELNVAPSQITKKGGGSHVLA
ncbi:MAG: (2Fe-2S)-binding protein, partial [Deltaproteobacteria bacterium]|nr:(2Fe-2S)-binding protein [Deltaproteobacteria bacterium]